MIKLQQNIFIKDLRNMNLSLDYYFDTLRERLEKVSKRNYRRDMIISIILKEKNKEKELIIMFTKGLIKQAFLSQELLKYLDYKVVWWNVYTLNNKRRMILEIRK